MSRVTVGKEAEHLLECTLLSVKYNDECEVHEL